MTVLGARAAAADVSVDAEVSRHAVPLGESASLTVTVHGAGGGVSDPVFDVPANLDVLNGGRSQSFSWINGTSSSEVAFHYELAPRAPGAYVVGPIRVTVSGRTFVCPPFTLTAVQGAAPAPGSAGGGGGGGPAPAALELALTPRDPYVGQPAVLSVRLVQRVPLAEDPRYSPPSTPGFWAERASEPESYYRDGPGGRVLVTETRTRLYPLTAGVATVSPASAVLVLDASGVPLDPFGWFGGETRRQIEIQSPALRVMVRPLPGGAPAGFAGAVGQLSARWSLDRDRTAQDQPLTARLEVRGSGNLPLIKTPDFRPPGFEVFGSAVDDSFGAPGTLQGGRRSFRWTILPRSLGALSIDPPGLAWFDPVARIYQRAALAPLTVHVDKATNLAAARAPGGFPDALTEHPLDPFARPAQPPLAALGGALLGCGIAALRAARRARGSDPRQRVREELEVELSKAKGPSAWPAAERAVTWLESEGVALGELRREIATARYGGGGGSPDAVRARVLTALRGVARRGGARWARPALAVAALALGVAALAIAAPHGGSDAGKARAAAADQKARALDLAGAEREWRELWRDGARAPGLAARLAWSRLQEEDVAAASLWVLRGERDEGRDAALEAAKQATREAGGLAGGGERALPVRRIEWSLLALVLGVAAGWAWPRAAWTIALAVALLACGVAVPIHERVLQARDEAVVMRETRLGGSDLDLEPGRVVRRRGGSGTQARVWVGPGIEGWLPADALREVGSLP